jgi:GNAT superfamily N-acetyltransferase
MIIKIEFRVIYEIWTNFLWTNRKSPIEPTSAMKYLGGYTLSNLDSKPTFFAYLEDGVIAGVNSGHGCIDNGYRSRGLYVFPQFRKKEIGRKLLLETIKQGQVENYTYIWSYPRQISWNTYQNAGFILTSFWEKSETSDNNAYCRLDF